MSSQIIQIADAVVSELNIAVQSGSFFPQSFTAIRGYRPVYDLEELKTLRVTVVPRKLEITGASRSTNQFDVGIDIAVQKKVKDGDQAELDGLMLLVEQIADLFKLRRLTDVPGIPGAGAIWTKTENTPIYAPEFLEQKHCFVSVLSLTYRVVR